jgi:cysteine sulfinate desulfinase/cysteine desulfurase-like protein
VESDGHNPAAPVQVKMSDVLLAMGVPEEFGLGTLRLSLGRHTTESDVDTAAKHIIGAIKAAWEKK